MTPEAENTQPIKRRKNILEWVSGMNKKYPKDLTPNLPPEPSIKAGWHTPVQSSITLESTKGQWHKPTQTITSAEIDQIFEEVESVFPYLPNNNPDNTSIQSIPEPATNFDDTQPRKINFEGKKKEYTIDQLVNALLLPSKDKKAIITNPWIVEQLSKLLQIQNRQLDNLIGTFTIGKYRVGLDETNENHIPKNEWRLAEALLLNEIKKLDPNFK